MSNLNPSNPVIQDVISFDQCPVRDQQRRRTDIFCVICPALFALILFIVSCATFNNYNLKRMTYYVDSEQNVCGFDQKTVDYKLVYFTSFTDSSKRLCVKQCPKQGDTSLNCYPTPSLSCYPNDNPKYEVKIYDSQIDINRIGGICLPTDPTLRNQIYKISHLENKLTFLNLYDSIWDALWLSVVFGVVLIILLQCMTRKLVHWIFIIGGLTFVAIGIVLMIVPDGFILFKILGGLFFIILGIFALASVIKSDFRREIFVCGRLFQIAAQMIRQNYFLLGLILLWIFLECCLLALISFQMLSAWSIGPITFDKQSPFLRVNAFISNFLSFFIFVEFIWALSFLKESFNFVVGGYATLWYCYRNTDKSKVKISTPFLRLIKYHWGSVAGGSLLLWAFYFFDLFIDYFFSSERVLNSNQDKIGRNSGVFNVPVQTFRRETLQRRGCRGFFDLIRSESFSYINLVSLPYCNSSRYCEMLSDDSEFYDRSQTTNRLYRICAHITLMMMATLIAFGSNRNTYESPGVFGVFFVAIVSLFTVTYFIALHGDLAEGILVSVFTQQRLSHIQPSEEQKHSPNQPIQRPPQSVKDLYIDDIADAYDNTSYMEYLKAHVQKRNDASIGHRDQELAIEDTF